MTSDDSLAAILGRDSQVDASSAPQRRTSSWLVLVAVMITVLLLAWLWRDAWLPAQAVTVVRAEVAPIQLEAVGDQATSVSSLAPAFSAAGWVEADPFSVDATGLVSGVVHQVRCGKVNSSSGGGVGDRWRMILNMRWMVPRQPYA